MQGKIKWFSKEKGYGYIVADDGKDFTLTLETLKEPISLVMGTL